MGLYWLDLIQFLEQFACVEFSAVLGPETLYGHVEAFGVGHAKEFCQLASPVFFWISMVSDSSDEIT